MTSYVHWSVIDSLICLSRNLSISTSTLHISIQFEHVYMHAKFFQIYTSRIRILILDFSFEFFYWSKEFIIRFGTKFTSSTRVLTTLFFKVVGTFDNLSKCLDRRALDAAWMAGCARIYASLTYADTVQFKF